MHSFELAIWDNKFLDFFNEPENSQRRLTPGVYDAKVFGGAGQQVQIILLDTRYFKGHHIKDTRSKEEKVAAGLSGSMGNYVPNQDASVTLLGAEQWAWLEQQLKQPADIRLIASSTQVIPDQKAMDEWGNYPLERQKLFDLIVSTQANGVVLLTGNVHFSEISSIDTASYPLVDFTSSGLTHTAPAYAKANNDYRIAGPFDGKIFGVVEIDWDAKPSPLATLKAVAEDGSAAFNHKVTLDQLQH